MYYHAYLRLEGGFQWWANLSQAELIADIVLPFTNRQIRSVRYMGGQALLNFGGGVYLRLFESDEKAPEPEVGDWVRTGNNPALRDCTTEVLDLARLGRASLASRSVLEAALGTVERQVFVVMQFENPELDSAYQGVIKPVAKAHGYRCLRIDEVQDSGRITDQILSSIGQSEIVFCDLTGQRPNCYYEAGWAHALGKTMILSIRRNEAIHFDLQVYRFILWGTELELRQQLETRFQSIQGGSLGGSRLTSA